MRLDLEVGTTLLGILVNPVRRYTFLRHMVHFLGTDLHLDRRAVRTDQCRMQRLIAIHLGDSDVVLELARNGLVERVQCPHCQVAGRDIADNHAETIDVEHLREGKPLLFHLAVDRIQAFFTTENPSRHPGIDHLAVDVVHDAREQFAPVAASRFERTGNDFCTQRVNQRKGQILQLTENLVETEPVGDRGIDLEGFGGDAATLVSTHGRHRLQIVQTVGQLDKDHAQVARHGHQHLAEVLGLRLKV